MASLSTIDYDAILTINRTGINGLRVGKMNNKGFTLVEIMIVVVIIGVLAVLAMPYYAKSRIQANAKACINNLRILEDAKCQFAIENKKANTSPYTISDLMPYLRNPETAFCPTTGQTYSAGTSGVGPVSAPPVCPNYSALDPEFSSHILGAI